MKTVFLNSNQFIPAGFFLCVHIHLFIYFFFHFSNRSPQDFTRTPLVNSSRVLRGVWDRRLAVDCAGPQAEHRRFCPWRWDHPGSSACVAQGGHVRLPPASLWGVVCDGVIVHFHEPVPGAAEGPSTSAAHQCWCAGQVCVPCDCWPRSQHQSRAHAVCHGPSSLHEHFPGAADRLPDQQGKRYTRGPTGWRGPGRDRLHLRICDPQSPGQGFGVSGGPGRGVGEQNTNSWRTVRVDI